MIAVRPCLLTLASFGLAYVTAAVDPVHGTISAGIIMTVGIVLSIALAAWGE